MHDDIYAVLDTNVLVSALLTSDSGSSPVVKVFKAVLSGRITPLYNQEILDEYIEVLSRNKFPFSPESIYEIIQFFKVTGIDSDRAASSEIFSDPDDVVFYEVAMSKDGAYLVTGNIKHFPKSPIVVSPAEMAAIMEGR